MHIWFLHEGIGKFAGMEWQCFGSFRTRARLCCNYLNTLFTHRSVEYRLFRVMYVDTKLTSDVDKNSIPKLHHPAPGRGGEFTQPWNPTFAEHCTCSVHPVEEIHIYPQRPVFSTQ